MKNTLIEEVAAATAALRTAKFGERILVTQEMYNYLTHHGIDRHSSGTLVVNLTGNGSASEPVQPMLHKAEQLINGARQQEYGDKLRNFDQIADFWNAHLKYKLAPGCKVTAEDVALMMIGVKQARLAKTPTHEDSVLDIAGYIGCYDKILDERRIRDEALIPKTNSV